MIRFLNVGFLLLGASVACAQDASTPPADGQAESPAVEQVAPETESPLAELEWMVGRWVDQGEGFQIVTNCDWTKNGHFLTRSFQVVADAETTLEGTQVIGWDPANRRIVSWTFDSEGGFGQGRWIRDGNRWLVKTSYTLATGEKASAVNVFTYVDENSFRWQSTAREVDGELQPSIPEVTVVRQANDQEDDEPNDAEVGQEDTQ